MVRPVIRVPAYEADEGFGPVSFGGGSDSSACFGSGRKPFSKVPSLLFDLEDLEDAAAHKPSTDAPADAALTRVLNSLNSLLEPWSEAEYMLLVHVRLAREDAAKRGQPLSVGDLADTLRRLGYTVKIRTALGGGWGGACLRNLRHTFLTIDLHSHGGVGHVHYILDPKFKEQFEVAHPTPRYRKVMDSLGQEVLATPDRLTKVVELLCTELAGAFTETGTPLPPWRQTAAMLSKWQPRRSEDRDVLPPCPSTFLNNALDGWAASGAPGGDGSSSSRRLGGPGGPSTVAQRMAALGPPVQLRGPSPIPEGIEVPSARMSLTSGSTSPCSVDSTQGSFHVGWPSGDLDVDAPAPPLPQQQAALQPRERAAATAQPVPMQQVWEGMRAAAAALPRQRNTWA